MRKSTIILGWIHLIIHLLIFVGGIILYGQLKGVWTDADFARLNHEQSQLGTFLFLFTWFGLFLIIVYLIFLGIYTFFNLISFMKLLNGKKVFFIYICNIILSIAGLFSYIPAYFTFLRDSSLSNYSNITLVLIIGCISSMVYSIFGLKNNNRKIIDYLR